MIGILAGAMLLLQTDFARSGEEWAAQQPSARCYVELGANMSDPTLARDPAVRARMLEIATRMAGVTLAAFYEISAIPGRRDADLAEKRDLVSGGLMSQAELTDAESGWASALQGQRYVLNRNLTRYPACDFLRPVRLLPDRQAIIDAARTVTEPPA